MDLLRSSMLKKFCSEINLNLLCADFVHCSPDWSEFDYHSYQSAFGFICSGEGWFKAGEVEFSPKPGQLYLLQEGRKHSRAVISENRYTKYFCHFKTAQGSKSLFDLLEIPNVVTPLQSDRIISLFKRLVTASNTNDFASAIEAKHLLYELLFIYLDSCKPQDIRLCYSPLDKPEFARIANYIEQNLHKKLTVDELALKFDYHPNYFFKLFKKAFGISPNQYINNLRIEKARQLVTTSGMSIAEISDCVGFANQHYFSILFKKHMGYSPSEYRKAYTIELLN